MIGIDWNDGDADFCLERIPSRLTDDDRRVLQERLAAMGLDQNATERAVSELEVCLKREFLRIAAEVTLPDPATIKPNIDALRKAAAQFLQAFTAFDQHCDYVVGQKLENMGWGGDLGAVIIQVKYIEEACSSLLSSWPKAGRRKKSGSKFIVNREQGAACLPDTLASNFPSFNQWIKDEKIVLPGGALTAEVRQAEPHDFIPVMKELDTIWRSITGANLGRSKNAVKIAAPKVANSSPFDPVSFVGFVLSKVHDGMTDTHADRKIRDFEEAVGRNVKNPVRRNEAP